MKEKQKKTRKYNQKRNLKEIHLKKNHIQYDFSYSRKEKKKKEIANKIPTK